MSGPTQCERVLRALELSGRRGVCQVDFLAPNVIDGGEPITRLAARVSDLKRDGHSIHYAGSRNKTRVYRLLSSFYDERPHGCWEWNGSVHKVGYGTINMEYAHRVIYEREVGPIPDGYDIDHLCRNKLCVNPAHLEPVPHAVNVRRGAQTRLTEEQVLAIRADPRSNRVLAAEYGVDRSYVSRLRNGHNWRPLNPHDPERLFAPPPVDAIRGEAA